MEQLIQNEIKEHIDCIVSVNGLVGEIKKVVKLIMTTLNNKNTVFLCGNGGSAADSQHIAAEFTGRFKKERRGLPAIALTTDTSALTAIANDYGYDSVFSRQLEALAKTGDILIAISTSGNSKSVLNAVMKAKEMHCKIIGLLGNNGGDLYGLCDLPIVINSDNTARIQEAHIFLGHIICSMVDYNTPSNE